VRPPLALRLRGNDEFAKARHSYTKLAWSKPIADKRTLFRIPSIERRSDDQREAAQSALPA
jgi:hypothetical protein